MWSSSSLFCVRDPPQLNKRHISSPPQANGWEYLASLNPQMASPHFPFSHVPSEIPFFRMETKVTHLQWRLPTSCTDMADPQVASCFRFDHRQAIHLLRHCSRIS